MDAGNQGLLGMCRDTLQGVLAGWSDRHLSVQVRHRARLRGHSADETPCPCLRRGLPIRASGKTSNGDLYEGPEGSGE